MKMRCQTTDCDLAVGIVHPRPLDFLRLRNTQKFGHPTRRGRLPARCLGRVNSKPWPVVVSRLPPQVLNGQRMWVLNGRVHPRLDHVSTKNYPTPEHCSYSSILKAIQHWNILRF